MRESIYYCKRRLRTTFYLFFNFSLLFALHIVTITITYFFFALFLVLFCFVELLIVRLVCIQHLILLNSYLYIRTHLVLRVRNIAFAYCLLTIKFFSFILFIQSSL